MNYGVAHAEYVATVAYSARGKLNGGTRSYMMSFRNVDTGKEIKLNEQNSRVIFETLMKLEKGEDWRFQSYEV